MSTSENFGALGDRPSHPELLDWLASEFRDDRSMKRMIRQIVLSATYRQSSLARPELLNPGSRQRPARSSSTAAFACRVDPRLRSMGQRSARSPEVGGKSCARHNPTVLISAPGNLERPRRGRPISPWSVRSVPAYVTLTQFWSISTCRGGYGPACRRPRSNTPLQALNLLNDAAFFEAAQALAARVLAEAPADPAARLDYAFRLCLAAKLRTARARLAAGLARAAEADSAEQS